MERFVIYRYTVGDRRYDTYFRSWENAQSRLLRDLERNTKAGWKVTGSRNQFNADKGYFCYDFSGVTDEGETFGLSLLDGYFAD